jgi:hypothetical protein
MAYLQNAKFLTSFGYDLAESSSLPYLYTNVYRKKRKEGWHVLLIDLKRNEYELAR